MEILSMNEVLLFTDIHIHPHKRRNERLEDCLKVLDWVFETAEKRKIKSILFGGDLFHDRQKIDVYTYQKTFEILQKWLKKDIFHLYLVLGNHDLWFNDQTSISSVTPLSSLPNVKVIDKPLRLNIEESLWDMIPFTHDPISAITKLDSQDGDPEYALGHLAIDGAILHGSSIADVAIEHDGEMVKISPNLFKKYKHVYLGHYHCSQVLEPNVEYIGSPLELSFGEAFQEKHIIILNCKSGKKEYITNDFSPKHLVISPEDIEKYDLDKNFVRVVVDDISATDLLDMRKDISKDKNLGSLEIRQQKRKIDIDSIDNAKAIIFKEDEMITQYVDIVGTGDLDRDKLIQIGKIICEKEIS
jgi:DNA repair exonuclease SbcCD nuclease subunit